MTLFLLVELVSDNSIWDLELYIAVCRIVGSSLSSACTISVTVTVHLVGLLQVILLLTIVSGLRIIHGCMSYCRFFFIICMHK